MERDDAVAGRGVFRLILAGLGGACLGVGPAVTGLILELHKEDDVPGRRLVAIGAIWFATGIASIYSAFPQEVARVVGRLRIGALVLVPLIVVLVFVLFAPPSPTVAPAETGSGDTRSARELDMLVVDALFKELDPDERVRLYIAREACLNRASEDACQHYLDRLIDRPWEHSFPPKPRFDPLRALREYEEGSVSVESQPDEIWLRSVPE